jgi:hypothetical protein
MLGAAHAGRQFQAGEIAGREAGLFKFRQAAIQRGWRRRQIR